MMQGRAVQTGSAADLYQRPSHPFVGHFIGSPGMNFVRARVEAFALILAGQRVPLGTAHHGGRTEFPAGDFVLGVRPEYVTLTEPHAPGAVLGLVTQRQSLGTYELLTAQIGDEEHRTMVRARVQSELAVPSVGKEVWLQLAGTHSCAYSPAEFGELQAAGVL
jgi:glycerol transport system ATP-binding protein